MTPGLRPRVRLFGSRPRSLTASRSHRQTARLTLLSAGLIILAAMVGMSMALETVKPDWRDPEFGHRMIRLEQIQRESPGRPLVLLLGTSRTQNALDPSAMGFPDERGSPCVFNFGQSGSPPLKVLLTLQRVFDAGIRPAAVVVEVMPYSLSSDGPAEGQLGKIVPRLSAADLRHLAPYCRDPGALRAEWLSSRVAPWSTQRTVLMSHWLPRWLSWGERIDPQWDGMEPTGFVPYPKQFATPEFRPVATAHAHHEYAGLFNGFRFGDSSRRALGDLVALCRDREIPVAFVELPVSPQFRGWFAPGVWAESQDQLHRFLRELDAEQFPPFEGLAESDFIDGHHMLSGPAARHSRWLADMHLGPWLIRKEVAR